MCVNDGCLLGCPAPLLPHPLAFRYQRPPNRSVRFPYLNPSSVILFPVCLCSFNKPYERSRLEATGSNFCMILSRPPICKMSDIILKGCHFFSLCWTVLCVLKLSRTSFLCFSKTAQFPLLKREIVSISITEVFFICF